MWFVRGHNLSFFGLGPCMSIIILMQEKDQITYSSVSDWGSTSTCTVWMSAGGAMSATWLSPPSGAWRGGTWENTRTTLVTVIELRDSPGVGQYNYNTVIVCQTFACFADWPKPHKLLWGSKFVYLVWRGYPRKKNTWRLIYGWRYTVGSHLSCLFISLEWNMRQCWLLLTHLPLWACDLVGVLGQVSQLVEYGLGADKRVHQVDIAWGKVNLLYVMYVLSLCM